MAEIDADIKEMLMLNEDILFIAKQSRLRPGGSKLTPNTIYTTNRRIIFRDPRWLGIKKDYRDIYYRDVNNIKLKKGAFSTEIRLFSRFQKDPVVLKAVSKKDAAQIGQIIQKGMKGLLPNQDISEHKTLPKIEVKQIESGDPIEQLEKLGKLKDAGLLSEEEFQRKKAELLKRI